MSRPSAQVIASTGVKGAVAGPDTPASGYDGEFNLSNSQDGALYSAFMVRGPELDAPETLKRGKAGRAQQAARGHRPARAPPERRHLSPFIEARASDGSPLFTVSSCEWGVGACLTARWAFWWGPLSSRRRRSTSTRSASSAPGSAPGARPPARLSFGPPAVTSTPPHRCAQQEPPRRTPTPRRRILSTSGCALAPNFSFFVFVRMTVSPRRPPEAQPTDWAALPPPPPEPRPPAPGRPRGGLLLRPRRAVYRRRRASGEQDAVARVVLHDDPRRRR